MKKLLLAAVSAAALCGAPALAADMAAKAPVYKAAPAPMFSWTGFYVGVNGGYGWNAGSSNVTAINVEIFEAVASTDTPALKSSGGFAGGQIGYNWQVAPQWIAGFEADFQGAGIKGSATAAALNPLPGPGADAGVPVLASATSNLDWFGTARVRLGYTLSSQTLFYATGGFAFGGVKDSLSVTELSEGILLSGAVNSNRTATGFVVGGGFETFITSAVSLKGEYQYIDLGSTTLATPALEPAGTPDCCDAPSGSAKISHTYHTARVGLNLKFGAH